MAAVDILIPTCERATALAATLTSLIAQDYRDFTVIVSDQSNQAASYDNDTVRAVVRILNAKDHPVRLLRNLPRRGMAHQRQFLLDQSTAARVLFIDDDVILEHDLLGRMMRALDEAACGFVACAVIGLSHRDDFRAGEQDVEFWDGPVTTEYITPDMPKWQRHRLHNAANLWHLQRALAITAQEQRLYKLAWAGGCVLYDSVLLRAAGAFEFWRDLPVQHCGEDVLAQLRVMAKSGGCGLMPSGAYHQELDTTITERSIDAPYHLRTLHE